MWLLGLLSTSSGILIGGGLAWLFKGLQQKINTIYAICAGLIFGLISIEILPEAIELGGWLITFVGITIGLFTFEFLHNVIHHNHDPIQDTSKKRMYIRTGLLLMFSFSFHNIPMGIILGTSQEYDFTTTLLQTLLLHSIPEGIILFTPLVLAGINGFVWLLVSVFVSTPVALGVFLGRFLGLEHQFISAFLISSTIGIILMVTVSEILFPVLIKSPIINIVIYILIGIGIMGIYLKLF